MFNNGSVVRTLAYADDTCIFGHTRETIQDMLDIIVEFFQWAGLSLNSSKCGALSMINNAKRVYVESFQPKLSPNQSIPAPRWEESYRYLGVQIGRERKATMEELGEEMINAAKKDP